MAGPRTLQAGAVQRRQPALVALRTQVQVRR